MGENLLPLAAAAGFFPKRPGGRTVCAKTLRRRIVQGVRGVRLRAVRDGREWFTCQAWVEEFLEECTRQTVPERERSERERTRACELARATLATKYGIKL